MIAESDVRIAGDGVQLEARLHEGDRSLSAVILHPHPQYGGDMNNHVVMAVAEAIGGAGASTLRFNFRGVGASTGAFAAGAGEADDAMTAVAYLRARDPSAPLLLAGYSFGAMIAAAVADRVHPAALLLISPPLAYGALPAFPAALPVLAIAGDKDPVSPAHAVRSLASPDISVMVVPGADHGWWPGLESLVMATQKFTEQAVRIHSDP